MTKDTAEEIYKETISVYNNCTLCGTELYFEHEPEPPENCIIEKSECPNCGLQGRRKTHTLH